MIVEWSYSTSGGTAPNDFDNHKGITPAGLVLNADEQLRLMPLH
jgi:hypothetical protein